MQRNMSDLFPREEIELITKKHLKMEFDANQDSIKSIQKFAVRDDDIFLVGFPKSGTTWTQEMVWLIVNNLDFNGAEVFIDERFPNIEIAAFKLSSCNPDITEPECHFNSIQFAQNMKSPRCIKTHLPLEMLPEQLLNKKKNAKIIYVARNIKDVCVSAYYQQINLFQSFDGTIDEFAKLYMNSFDFVPQLWNTLKYFWNRRHEENVLFLRYEELKNDLRTVIQRVSKFLNKELTIEDERKLMKWLNFETMKHNSAVNHNSLYNKSGFMRVGKVGEHKKELSPEIIEKFDIWLKSNSLDSDYVNDYNISE